MPTENPLSKIEISKENLLRNLAQCRKNISSETKVAAVVKGNAYGHGVKEAVSILDGQVDYFQVDDLLELQEIREYTNSPVLVLGYIAEEQLNKFVELDATLGIYDLDTARRLNEVAGTSNKKVRVHVKVDSLLGRQGITVADAQDFFRNLQNLNNIEVEAIYSHFSNIEDVDDLEHATAQHVGLMEAKKVAQQVGFKNIVHHISATSGIMTEAGHNWGGAIVRFGIGLYGLWPSDSLRERFGEGFDLRPVMRWTTKVAQIKNVPQNYPVGYGCTFVTKRDSRIAVIPQGYSDGYGRHFSNNSEVLIGGVRCPVAGRIAMNMFVVDVTDAEKVLSREIKKDEEVVLLGKQGDDEITADELAERVQTINYEIVTHVWPKLPRAII
jgi:alanine racemase